MAVVVDVKSSYKGEQKVRNAIEEFFTDDAVVYNNREVNGREYDIYNVSKYTTEVFRMFSTDEAIDVTLLCDNCIMKSVVDKFGMKIKTQSVGEEKFRIKVKVCVSPTFYRWVFGATGKIMIEGPSNVRKAYKEMLQKSLDSMN